MARPRTISTVPKYVEDNYRVEKEIAKGKFGVVYHCQDKAGGGDVAVKVMLRRHNNKEDVAREVEILKKIDHPKLLSFGNFKEDCLGNYILVTELLTGGELFDYCTSKDYLLEGEAVFFMKQILDGLEYLHERKICHLDLKPENIVLKDQTSKVVKIIDFGAARDLSSSPNAKVMVGTPEFIAPEVLNYDPVTCYSDMWAIGVITFCLLTGCSPFLGDNDGETIQNVTLGEFDFPEPDEEEGYEDITDSAKDFITKLLTMAPRRRLSASEALEHRWIASLRHTQSRINTDRLKRLKRRRKLLAAMQAVRLSVGLFRAFSRSSSISSGSSPPLTGGRSRTNGSMPDPLAGVISSSSPPRVTAPVNKAFTLPKRLEGPVSPLCNEVFD